ncbi:MAG: transposase [Hyphomicrobiales bacterium]|nr:MAG: transposase [Hyphomicrobiales bacterium]
MAASNSDDAAAVDTTNRGLGRSPDQNRSIVKGNLYRLRCGTPWRDVPLKYHNWTTIYRRFRRSSEAGVWEVVSVALAEIIPDSGHYGVDAPRFVPMSGQRAEKGDSSTRSWPLAGRVH